MSFEVPMPNNKKRIGAQSVQSSESSYPQAFPNMRKWRIAGSVWTTVAGSHQSRMQSAAVLAKPKQRSASRNGPTPLSEEIRPPSQLAFTILRRTAGGSIVTGVS